MWLQGAFLVTAAQSRVFGNARWWGSFYADGVSSIMNCPTFFDSCVCVRGTEKREKLCFSPWALRRHRSRVGAYVSGGTSRIFRTAIRTAVLVLDSPEGDLPPEFLAGSAPQKECTDTWVI
ncbi:hypothetical protein CC2G_006979 [Coprinopsis cinerea AmutBmut pab1-1]|nr:hypothetical protein CC2G_006979 [Coprinopsis cinerea AmutBmut pab1-1]